MNIYELVEKYTSLLVPGFRMVALPSWWAAVVYRSSPFLQWHSALTYCLPPVPGNDYSCQTLSIDIIIFKHVGCESALSLESFLKHILLSLPCHGFVGVVTPQATGTTCQSLPSTVSCYKKIRMLWYFCHIIGELNLFRNNCQWISLPEKLKYWWKNIYLFWKYFLYKYTILYIVTFSLIYNCLPERIFQPSS